MFKAPTLSSAQSPAPSGGFAAPSLGPIMAGLGRAPVIPPRGASGGGGSGTPLAPALAPAPTPAPSMDLLKRYLGTFPGFDVGSINYPGYLESYFRSSSR